MKKTIRPVVGPTRLVNVRLTYETLCMNVEVPLEASDMDAALIAESCTSPGDLELSDWTVSEKKE